MNAPRCNNHDYIQFLVASPGPVTCTEAARVQLHSACAPDHDSFKCLLHWLEPEPEELWQVAEGFLVIDASTLDKLYTKKTELVTRHWSGKHYKVVRGINLITLLWTDGDRKTPCDYRIYSKADGKTKHDHFWELLLTVKARGFAPKYVLFDSWYASLENLKQVRDHGWLWLTRLKGDRVVSPAGRIARLLDEVAVFASGTVLHLRGYGLVKVFRIDVPDGDTEYWATNDLAMVETVRRHGAEIGFAIENYHRELKQFCGVERCQVRAGRASATTSGWRCGPSRGWNGIASPPGSVRSKPG